MNYQGQQLTTVTDNRDDSHWFVGGEVAKILGYRGAYNMARNLDEDDKGSHIVSSLGGGRYSFGEYPTDTHPDQ